MPDAPGSLARDCTALLVLLGGCWALEHGHESTGLEQILKGGCCAGWSSPGIAHYLGAELPTVENGLASSLKILSRGDSGLSGLANHEAQPRYCA